jgi:hypothetical protein
MGATWEFIRDVAWKDFKKLMSIIWKGLKGGFNFVTGKRKK